MFNFDLLLGRIHNYQNGITLKRLSSLMDMSEATLRKRLRGEGFDSSEIVSLCKILNIDPKDINLYFFNTNFVEFKSTKC